LVSKALTEQIHDAGKKIMVWTVNDSGQIKNLAGWATDAIISDDTQLAGKALQEI
jgi:glycerophosphoryl diester phosphodiesterase